jgi:hypothetical protein
VNSPMERYAHDGGVIPRPHKPAGQHADYEGTPLLFWIDQLVWNRPELQKKGPYGVPKLNDRGSYGPHPAI